MTRKKFVKQLMALGYQRNTANIMAMCARVSGRTYERYLQEETERIAWCRSVLSIKTSLTECLTPVVKSATEALDRLREALAGVEWKVPDLSALFWVTEQVAEDPLPPWPKENPHRCDAMDALTYNMQIMSQADRTALHGCACGIDLAAGPDMTAYMPQGGDGNE